MGLCLCKTSSSWSDLPPEIAGDILSRVPSHDDRLSFKAVCRGWRLASLLQGQQVPQAVPCINLGHGMYQSVADDDRNMCRRRRFSTTRGFRASPTFGGWILYEHKRSGRCFLRDPLSTSTLAMEIPCRYQRYIYGGVTGSYDPHTTSPHLRALFDVRKIIVCSSPLIVIMLSRAVFRNPPANFACFRPGTRTLLWSHAAGTSGYQHGNPHSFFKDIVFHLGKVFAVDSTEHLFTHSFVGEMGYENQCNHVIRERPATAVAGIISKLHLVASSDKQKLIMVRWSIPRHANHNDVDHQIINVQVFEAELNKGQWSEVKNLDGQVLFVGQTGSKALAPTGLSEHYYGQNIRRGNCVVLLGHEWAWERRFAGFATCWCLDCQKLPHGIPSYCVYDMLSGGTSLVSLGDHDEMTSSKLEWFFPSE